MICKGNMIIFKSSPEFYEKEKKGLKNNTVRFLSWQEFSHVQNSENISLIKIVNSLTGDSFCREIKDISQYQDITIFTWKQGDAASDV